MYEKDKESGYILNRTKRIQRGTSKKNSAALGGSGQDERWVGGE